jgi:hypothetical protein
MHAGKVGVEMIFLPILPFFFHQEIPKKPEVLVGPTESWGAKEALHQVMSRGYLG